MKALPRVFLLLLLLSLFSFLTGCSYTPPTSEVLTAHQQTESAREKCYEAQREKESANKVHIEKLPQNQQLFAMLMRSQQESNLQTIYAVTGNNPDPCSATNVFDTMIAEVTEKNKTARRGLQTAETGLKYGAGAVAVDSLVKGMSGATYSLTDNAKLNQQSENSGSLNTQTSATGANTNASTPLVEPEEPEESGESGEESIEVPTSE